MNGKNVAKPKWTAADRARHKAVREQFAHCPTQEDLQASGDYESPVKSGAYFAVRLVVHELKQARQAAGLTLATVATLTGMGQAALSRLERGLQPNPTIDTLWRYGARHWSANRVNAGSGQSHGATPRQWERD